MREEKNLQYSAQLLTCGRTSFFTATVSLRCLRTFFILNVLLPTGIKMWCTLLWYSNSHCMQSVHLLVLNMVFVLILTALCSKVQSVYLLVFLKWFLYWSKTAFFLKSIHIYMWSLLINFRRRKLHCYFTDYKRRVSWLKESTHIRHVLLTMKIGNLWLKTAHNFTKCANLFNFKPQQVSILKRHWKRHL